MKKKSEKMFCLFSAVVIFAVSSVNLISCKDTFSNLIPNNEQKIIGFNLKNLERSICSTGCRINGQSITVTVPAGTDVTNLLPEAVISAQATLFPITLRYLQEAFPATDILKLADYANNTQDIGALDKWFLSLYSDNPDFNIPPLVFTVNFLSPVNFAVIGGQGGFEMYTVKVMYDDGTDPGTGLLPPGVVAEKNILSFTVPEQQIGTSVISEEQIDFKVKAETEVRSLLPVITASEGAIVLPVTQEYIKRFCDENGLDYLNVLSGFITAPDKRVYLRALIAPLDISRIRVNIDKPIDFTDPVFFAVLGKDKDVKLYTATCKKDSGEAYLENFAITKFRNPAIVTDGKIEIDRSAKTVNAALFYPVEYAGSTADAFSLFCDAVFIGDSAELEYKGVKYNLPEDKIPFTPENPQGQYSLGSAKADLHIKNAGVTTSYRLNLIFKEDPDTVRSITDFRFEKFYNDGIKNTAMAAISNDGHEGTISVTVLYGTAEKPETLVPSFISAGKVTVNGAVQHSTVDAQDFRTVKVYLCTSKNGQYTRRYTVKVKFIKVETAQPMLKSFKFPYNLNSKLSNDAIGRIDELTNSVYVNVQYSSQEVPEVLIPEFSATGDVTVNGLIQSSGFSSQNFKYTVYYKVSGPSDPSVSKTYGVHVAFTFAQDSGCELLSFSLLAADNPSLTADIEVPISKYSNKLYAVLPKSAEITNLIPSFTAKGRITVEDIEQTSGVSAVDFSAPIEYTVTSENGLYIKRYIVKLQKAGDIIYVNTSASGRNNGLTWEDAFIRLDMALEKAESLAPDTIPEIWIIKDSKLTENFKINRQLILRGGFGGAEVSEDQRNKENRTVFSGITFSSDKEISGKLIFDSLQFKVNAQPVQEIKWAASQENSLELKNCTFTGGAKLDIENNLALLKIADSEFDAAGSLSTKADFTGGIEILNSEFYCPVFLNTSNTVNAENCKLSGNTITANAENISVTQTEIKNTCTLSAAKNITLTRLRSYNAPINITAVYESTVIIESSNIMEKLIFKNGTAAIKKLNAVTIKNSFIGELTAENKIITGRLYCSGKYAGLHFTGNNLTLPACQTEITNASFKGTVNTLCAKDVFGQITNINLSTKINNIEADTLKCGFIKSNQKEVLKSNIYVSNYLVLEGIEKLNEMSYLGHYKAAADINKEGVQEITSCYFKQCFVFSGDKINFSNNTMVGLREQINSINENNRKNEFIHIGNYGIGELYDFQFVILKNSATENSSISVSNVTSSCGWFRAETNILNVDKLDRPTTGEPGHSLIDPIEQEQGISGFSRAEFYGLTSVNIHKSDFTDIQPVRYSKLHSNKELYYYNESFIAAGNKVKIRGNTFKYNTPVLIGSIENFDISGNKFTGENPYPNITPDEEDGNQTHPQGNTYTKQYFELTLFYPKNTSFSNLVFTSLNITPCKLFNDLLNYSSNEPINEFKADNCYFANGLSVEGKKDITVRNCSFGKRRPFIHDRNFYGTLNFHGKVNATVENLNIKYKDVYNVLPFHNQGNWIFDHIHLPPAYFRFIDMDRGNIIIKNCEFENFKRLIKVGHGDIIAEICSNTFKYKKIDENTNIDIPNLVEFYRGIDKLIVKDCKFIGEDITVKGTFFGLKSVGNLTFESNNFEIKTKESDRAVSLSLNNNSTKDIKINNCIFGADVKIEHCNITMNDCEFKNKADLLLDSCKNITMNDCKFYNRAAFTAYSYEEINLKKSKFNYGSTIFLEPYHHYTTSSPGSHIINPPRKMYVENCDFISSSNEPWTFIDIKNAGTFIGRCYGGCCTSNEAYGFGTVMVLFKYDINNLPENLKKLLPANANNETALTDLKTFLSARLKFVPSMTIDGHAHHGTNISTYTVDGKKLTKAFLNLPDGIDPSTNAADTFKISL